MDIQQRQRAELRTGSVVFGEEERERGGGYVLFSPSLLLGKWSNSLRFGSMLLLTEGEERIGILVLVESLVKSGARCMKAHMTKVLCARLGSEWRHAKCDGASYRINDLVYCCGWCVVHDMRL